MSGPLQIARLTARDRVLSERWDAFVQAQPQATFFHLSGWLRVIEAVFGHRGHYLLAERDGLVEGVLPLVEVKSRLFGHSLASLPFAVYGGVVASTPEAAAALETEAERIAKARGVQHLEYRNLGGVRHEDWQGQPAHAIRTGKARRRVP